MPDVLGHHVHTVTVGAGAPAVMVHCMLSRHDALLPLAKSIGGQVTLLDMPGHGRSDDWDGKTAYQPLVTAAIAACCDGPTHIIGHSFGGTAALRLAVERPNLVSRLTLIEPVYFAAAKGTAAFQDHHKAFRPFLGAMLTGDEPRAAAVFNKLWANRDWDDVPARLQHYLTARIHLVVAGGAELEVDEEGITSEERLARLKVPVTLIRGSETVPVIGEIHDNLRTRIPNATDHAVAGAGHMLSMDHADDVAAIIRSAGQETG